MTSRLKTFFGDSDYNWLIIWPIEIDNPSDVTNEMLHDFSARLIYYCHFGTTDRLVCRPVNHHKAVFFTAPNPKLPPTKCHQTINKQKERKFLSQVNKEKKNPSQKGKHKGTISFKGIVSGILEKVDKLVFCCSPPSHKT